MPYNVTFIKHTSAVAVCHQRLRHDFTGGPLSRLLILHPFRNICEPL